tara:strand:+ start:2945 stop:3622 length:678 start_codon:yes stop_codon:yes gene_type:complete
MTSIESEKSINIIKQIATKDNSITFYNNKYKEHYHSTTGAKEEVLKKFVNPCKHLFNKNKLNVLDICFGLGYNSAGLIDTVLNVNPNCNINIIGLENDINILNKIKDVNIDFRNYKIIKQFKINTSITLNNITLKIILGDARQTIKSLKTEFDIILLDPFSPKQCPELWTLDFFKEIFNKMNIGGVLTTYSCARIVRYNLKQAGFIVKDGPKVERRGPSTIAIKK